MRRGGAALLDRATQVIPGLSDRVPLDACTLQIGVRPYPEGGLPIIGPLPGADDLIIVATHSGITLGPAIADHMVGLVQGNPAPELADFGLSRFPGF